MSLFAVLASGCTEPGEVSAPEPLEESPRNDAETENGLDGADGEDGQEAGDEQADNSNGDVGPGDSETMELLGELPGQLAIGDGTRLLVGRPDGQGQVEVDGGTDVLASQPTWSQSATQLVWTSVSAEEQLARVLEFDEQGLPVGEPINSDISGPPIFYYQWSSDDQRLLYLRNSPAGAQVEAGWLAPGSDAVPVAVGSPFFASWAPDGETVAVHRNNFEIGIFDQFSDESVAGDPEVSVPIASLPRTRGEFTAPAWINETQIAVVSNGALVAAELDPVGPSLTVAGELVGGVGSVRFVVSPDRSKLAYQRPPDPESEVVEAALSNSARPTPARPIQSTVGSLVVLDLETGEEAVVTDQVAVAWEWSPNGSRLAWLEPDQAGTARWQFWSTDPAVGANLAGNAVAPSIRLSRKYLNNYLPFFAQYTHSVTGWSPDSTAYATAGAVDGVDAIWLQLIDTTLPAVPISNGDFVTWGGGPTPPTSGAPIT